MMTLTDKYISDMTSCDVAQGDNGQEPSRTHLGCWNQYQWIGSRFLNSKNRGEFIDLWVYHN